MVYHYSDGTLEYEEHFNASNVLQEVLKYSYDADGNVEYLLYKDNNFSNANAYDLYYYVRDAVGNITDLFQIREQSGSSTTVVNRITAHYEYDPYGNILSVDTYNNDNIGNINPIRYKDYYYDAETGWYQLSSRFYDPEVGRFLNADDLSLITETESGVIDKNLYAYCDGNPVMRKDNNGSFWFASAAIGAVVGAAIEVGYQMVVEKKSLSQVDWMSVGSSALSGALAGSGVGKLGQFAVNAAIGAVESARNGGNVRDVLVGAGLGALSGAIGGRGANYKGVLSNASEYAKKSISKETRRLFNGNRKYAIKHLTKIRAQRNSLYYKTAVRAGGRYTGGYVAARTFSYYYYRH